MRHIQSKMPWSMWAAINHLMQQERGTAVAKPSLEQGPSPMQSGCFTNWQPIESGLPSLKTVGFIFVIGINRLWIWCCFINDTITVTYLACMMYTVFPLAHHKCSSSNSREAIGAWPTGMYITSWLANNLSISPCCKYIIYKLSMWHKQSGFEWCSQLSSAQHTLNRSRNCTK